MEHDISVHLAGSRFNSDVPCECGLGYCDGWANPRTRLRHLKAVGKQRDDDTQIDISSEYQMLG